MKSAKTARTKVPITSSSDSGSLLSLPYQRRVSFYRFPPVEEVRVDEFVQFASDRLRVLKELDVGKIRGLKADELRNRIRESLAKYLPLSKSRADIRKDVISHFVLRLAFCSTPESRKWFLKQECELLHHRLTSDQVDIATFLMENEMAEQCLTQEEFKSVRNSLSSCHRSHLETLRHDYYYKVDFTEVLNLVSHRTVYLQNGKAYVSRDDLLSLVQNKFRQHISLELTKAFRAEPLLSKDERIHSILQALAKSHDKGMEQTYDFNQRHLDPLQIDSLAKQAFPLCAQNMHRNLKKNHHLKHWARVQYGLFLKAAGLPMDGALEFWKREFCLEVGMDSHTFDRKYSYNFRHLYGKEGKRCDWSPYGCGKIITSFKNPGEGEHHGCPYQTFDSERLRLALEETMRQRPNRSSFEDWEDVKKSINEITSLAKEGHYQIACRKEFEMRVAPKRPSSELIIHHPNSYLNEMLKFCSDVEETPAETNKRKRDSQDTPTTKDKGKGEEPPPKIPKSQ